MSNMFATAAVSVAGLAVGFWAGWNLYRLLDRELTVRRESRRLDEELARLQ